jgi:hypothetical protein
MKIWSFFVLSGKAANVGFVRPEYPVGDCG